MSAAAVAGRRSEIRRDRVFGRWVILSPARARRPTDFKSKSPAPAATGSCPFCLGRESECAPEIFRVPDTSGGDWRLRVIENLYPALPRDGVPPPLAAAYADADVLPGFGFHDVVIETPRHDLRLWDLEIEKVRDIVLAYKKRVLQLAECESIKYAQVFKNHGASAGASMSHSHSQIVGTPFIPPSVSSRQNCMKEVFEKTGKCCLCEISSDSRIDETSDFWAVVPFAATYPFEIWVVPKEHKSHFHDIDEDKALRFGALVKLMLQKLSKQLDDPPFNYMIHTAPFGLQSSCLPYSHWFLQIVPQLGVVGGFELGSGCFINPVFPEDAAKILRDVDCST